VGKETPADRERPGILGHLYESPDTWQSWAQQPAKRAFLIIGPGNVGAVGLAGYTVERPSENELNAKPTLWVAKQHRGHQFAYESGLELVPFMQKDHVTKIEVSWKDIKAVGKEYERVERIVAAMTQELKRLRQP